MKKYIAVFEVEDDCNILTMEADVEYTYETNGTNYKMREGIEFAKEKTGQWVDDKCSTCGKGIEELIASSEWYRNENPKYCPFCGIKILSYNNKI